MIASGWSAAGPNQIAKPVACCVTTTNNARSWPQVRLPGDAGSPRPRASLIFQVGDLKTTLLSSRDVPRL